ncbi:MAG: hypothetical protein WAN03_07515 [Candidatus Sulfotelmatobacter sp.]
MQSSGAGVSLNLIPSGSILSIAVLLLITTGCGSLGSSSTARHAPGVSLSSAPAAVALQQNASGSVTINVNTTGGFSGSVALTVSGLPTGVTASLSPASTNSQSTLTFNVSASAPTGTATITINGTSGSFSPTTQISLAVLAAPVPGSVTASFFALNNVAPSDDPAADGMFYGAVGHPIRLAWPYIETSRGNFNFSFYDQYAAIAPKAASGRVAMMDLTLGITPSWAVSSQNTCRTLPNPGGPTITGCQAPPDNIQDWKDFINALVQHYNGSVAPHIQYYEIWNEWNTVDAQNGFWSGTVQQLVSLQTAACTIIHGADSFSMVLTPSTVGAAATAGAQAPGNLQTYLSAGGTSCPGAPGNLIDGVSFHGNLGLASLSPFPQPGEGCAQNGCNGTIVQIANSYREVMNANGLQGAPLLDTEGGFESANIPDNDQRAAWLAQFYALQAGLFNSDQLQWVSWFTWGAPGVAGNIETGNNTPDEAGIAYNQLYLWEINRLPSPCTQTGKIWTCPLTGSAGYQAEIVWDDSQTCANGVCTTNSTFTAPSGAVQFRDIAGNVTQITTGTVPVGLKPIIIENQ